ncbi:hypothetical protein KAR91_45075 [Candidatus Pacearchaeota archaeon]|nr:hypothetical protein [Candidatus Pacearchaeota archaeon]
MPNENEKKEAEDKTSKGEKDNENNKGDDGNDNDAAGKSEEVSPEVKKLRKENAKKRIENKELRDKLVEAEAKKAEAGEKNDSKEEKSPSQDKKLLEVMNQRLIRAELKAAALKAGLLDIDALKMFDISSLEVTDVGDVIGIENLIEEMKESKAWAFNQQAKDTSSAKKTPGASAPSSKNALEMSDDEYAVEAKKHGINVENHY